jgi:DNA-binding LacI/PurR family transcriptional regulator
MSTTIYEVAKSGFSIGTVSRVLNGIPLHTEETREKVLQVIDELDFQPHVMAQGLARRKNATGAAANAIGVLFPFFTGDADGMEMLAGIQRSLAQHNFDLILYGVDELPKQDAFLQRILQQRRVDGMLLVSMKLSGALAVACKRRRLPLVLVDNFHHQFDSISVDHQAGAFLAIQHLLGLGYHHFAILTGHDETISEHDRLQACRLALRDAGIAVSDNMIIISELPKAEPSALNGRWQAGYFAMKDFIERRLQNGETYDLPLAVFVTGDWQMLGAIRAVQQAGWRIPDDVTLIGFDDGALAEHAGLMSVRLPKREMGYQAAKRLLAILDDPDSSPQHVSLQPELVVRKSDRKNRCRKDKP